jgi:excisionase family DNA binding protein
MNQGITDEGTPELGAHMTSESKESNFTAGNPSGEVLLTADEVAQILRVPRSWVYSHSSDLPVIRLGRYVRFRRSEINGFLEKRRACQ